MSLQNRAILEIDGAGDYADRTGVFVLREDLDDTETIEPTHLVGNRGQYISELYEQATGLDPTDILPESDQPRRAGYHLDGGAGEDEWTISGTTAAGDPDEQWGDGSTDPDDADDVSSFDATGCHPTAKRDILGAWIAQNRIDSGGQARLYRGEWSDGTYADEPGAFNEPITVAVQNAQLQRESGDSSAASITIELVRTTSVPDITDQAEDIVDAVGDFITDW